MSNTSSNILCGRCGVQYCQNINICDVETVSFNWFVNEAVFENHSAASTEFSTVSREINWRMYLSYRFDEIGRHHKFKLFLELCSSNTRKVFAKCKISLARLNLQPMLSFTEKRAIECSLLSRVPVLTDLDLDDVEPLLGKMLFGGGLMVVCQITTPVRFDDRSPTARKPRLFRDFASFIENEDLSDVTLNIKGQRIYAHKVILAACSPVFRAMFADETNEKGRTIVEIKDVECSTFRELLRFIYTGNAPALNMNNVKDVLVASNIYGIKILLSICEQYLASNITPETAVDILIFAEKYNVEELRAVTLKFIHDHDEVLDTPAWQLLEEEEKNLVIMFLKKMLLSDSPHSKLS